MRRRGSARIALGWMLALALVGCGGGEGATDADEVVDADGQSSASGDSSTGGEGPTEGDDAQEAADAGGSAGATLVVGDRTIEWAGNEWTYCEIGGLFPANVEFQVEEVKQEGDWFQFIDRGDGGVNFSAVLDGEEYGGTGSGKADEIRDDGFTYTGSLNRGGEVLDTSLDPTC